MPGWDSGKAVGDISGRKPNPVPEVSILRGWALAGKEFSAYFFLDIYADSGSFMHMTESPPVILRMGYRLQPCGGMRHEQVLPA